MGIQYVGTGRILVGTGQDVTIGAASAACTNAFGTQTYKIRVKATSDCRVKINKAPTATATDTYMGAGDTEWFTCNPGEKIACIQVSAGGTLNVTEGY
ncbi:hypothetical protein [Bradyrhizobium lablabi]|uniref:hypothetical protein n=1 Tax=Bradyrhizobium lablabi TaxID=722472 RepID=UPI00090BABEE|nr:hypothetical protein [Bradyrhizobium lablabi]SHM41110.1 hypothetical protein SAMN05444321_6253 [Bradyrhizobium lablabi]